MTKTRTIPLLAILYLAALALLPAAAHAEGPDCATCHEDLATGKSVHPAVMMGCASCHTAVDAADVPHKITNRNPKGLSAKMKDLCFGCHEKKNFQKTTVHGALMLGCTSCHNPHVSDHARVLKEEIPRLCLHCHEEKLSTLTAQNNATHAHAKTDRCSDCHSPHATDTPKLVLTKPQGNGDGKTALIQKPSVPQQ
jgi:predicted CXXCH cytochrome family protein